MKRAAEERHLAEYTKKQHVSLYFYRWDRPNGDNIPVNRFRKARRIGGCGKSRCFLCHHEKLLGIKTIWELKADAAEKDGRSEIE